MMNDRDSKAIVVTIIMVFVVVCVGLALGWNKAFRLEEQLTSLEVVDSFGTAVSFSRSIEDNRQHIILDYPVDAGSAYYYSGNDDEYAWIQDLVAKVTSANMTLDYNSTSGDYDVHLELQYASER